MRLVDDQQTLLSWFGDETVAEERVVREDAGGDVEIGERLFPLVHERSGNDDFDCAVCLRRDCCGHKRFSKTHLVRENCAAVTIKKGKNAIDANALVRREINHRSLCRGAWREIRRGETLPRP